MTEIGQVVGIKKKTATVKVDKKDECSKCGMCLFKDNAGYTEFHADNKVGAKVGDTVRIETSEKAKFIGILLVFVVPLLLIGVSALITYTAIKQDIYMLVLSAASVIVWFFILPFIDKAIAKKNKMATEIVEIVFREIAEEKNI